MLLLLNNSLPLQLRVVVRVEMMGMKVEREDKSVARYTTSSQDHISAPQNPVR